MRKFAVIVLATVTTASVAASPQVEKLIATHLSSATLSVVTLLSGLGGLALLSRRGS